MALLKLCLKGGRCTMSKNERTERIRKAEDKVSELVDYILETTAAPDFEL